MSHCSSPFLHVGLGRSQVFSSLRGCSVQLQERQRVGRRPNTACTLGSHSTSWCSQRALGLPGHRPSPARQKRQDNTTFPGAGSSRKGRPFVTNSIVTATRKESISFSSLRATILKGRKEPGTLTCPCVTPLPGSVCLCKKGWTGLHPAREQTCTWQRRRSQTRCNQGSRALVSFFCSLGRRQETALCSQEPNWIKQNKTKQKPLFLHYPQCVKVEWQTSCGRGKETPKHHNSSLLAPLNPLTPPLQIPCHETFSALPWRFCPHLTIVEFLRLVSVFPIRGALQENKH